MAACLNILKRFDTEPTISPSNLRVSNFTKTDISKAVMKYLAKMQCTDCVFLLFHFFSVSTESFEAALTTVYRNFS